MSEPDNLASACVALKQKFVFIPHTYILIIGTVLNFSRLLVDCGVHKSDFWSVDLFFFWGRTNLIVDGAPCLRNNYIRIPLPISRLGTIFGRWSSKCYITCKTLPTWIILLSSPRSFFQWGLLTFTLFGRTFEEDIFSRAEDLSFFPTLLTPTPVLMNIGCVQKSFSKHIDWTITIIITSIFIYSETIRNTQTHLK